MPGYLEWGLGLFQKISKKLISSKKYGIDYAKLIRENPTIRSVIEETIGDETSLDPKIFNINRIKEIFRLHVEERENYAGFLILLLTFGRWYKKYGPRT